jgi:uncharacterized protein (DUF885 family)
MGSRQTAVNRERGDFMFLSKDEKILVLLARIEVERAYTLFGGYKSYAIGEKKIRKLKQKIEKLGGNSDARILIDLGEESK